MFSQLEELLVLYQKLQRKLSIPVISGLMATVYVDKYKIVIVLILYEQLIIIQSSGHIPNQTCIFYYFLSFFRNLKQNILTGLFFQKMSSALLNNYHFKYFCKPSSLFYMMSLRIKEKLLKKTISMYLHFILM